MLTADHKEKCNISTQDILHDYEESHDLSHDHMITYITIYYRLTAAFWAIAVKFLNKEFFFFRHAGIQAKKPDLLKIALLHKEEPRHDDK